MQEGPLRGVVTKDNGRRFVAVSEQENGGRIFPNLGNFLLVGPMEMHARVISFFADMANKSFAHLPGDGLDNLREKDP